MNVDLTFEGFCIISATNKDFSVEQQTLIRGVDPKLKLEEDLGMDSFSRIEYISFLEKTFDVMLPIFNKEFYEADTLHDYFEYVLETLNENRSEMVS